MPTRRTLVLALSSTWTVVTVPGWAQTRSVVVGGVAFERRMQVGGQELRLNGAGLRAVASFKGYAAGLYLAQSASSTAQVLRTPGAKRLRMRMLVAVSTEEFIKAIHKGVERNVPSSQQGVLSERITAFDGVLRGVGKVKTGDVIDLDYLPGSGLVLAINGRQRSQPIAGDDFYAALMLVFIGERPVDAALKRQLLAGSVA